MRVAGEGELETLLAAGRGEDLVAVRGEDGGDRRGQVVVVVDHQYAESLVRHPFPPGPVGGHASMFVRPRTNPIGKVRKRIRRVLPEASGRYTCGRERRRGEEASMKGYGPDGGTQSPRVAGVNTFLRLPHVTQFDGVDVAIVGLPFDTGLAVRTGARFGPRADPRGLAHHPPRLQPGAARGGLRPPLGGRRRRRARGRRLHRPQPRRHGGPRSPRCTRAGARAARHRRRPHGHARRAARRGRAGTARSPCCTSARTRTASSESAGQRYIHSTVVRRAVEEGLVDAVALRPPRHARRHRLPGRVRPGARARLHRRAVGRPRAARHRRGRRGGRGDRRRARRSSPSTSTSSTRASRPAVGTPEVGGPSSAQALALIRGCRGLDLAGADVVEVVPELDSSHLTATVAATIAYELLSLMACSGGTCE